MHQITSRIDFCFGHRLVDYVGKCENVHGHNSIIEITLSSDRLDNCGFVVDFGDIKKYVKEWVDTNWDHAYLCHREDIVGTQFKELNFRTFVFTNNPTAENMSAHLYYIIETFICQYNVSHNSFVKLEKVVVYENPGNCAEYSI